MDDDVLSLGEIDQTQVAVAGGKGAQLGELSRIEGIHVPAGFLHHDGRLPADDGERAIDGRTTGPAVADGH
jgi:hypothetical protein